MTTVSDLHEGFKKLRMEKGGLQIVLACGYDHYEGCVHVDMSPVAVPDVLHDLRIMPWPFEDNSATFIIAERILEHLADTVAFMDECWRILMPGGQVYIKVPHWHSVEAWRDPTHLRAFVESTFDYFDDFTWHGEHYGKLYTPRRWKILQRYFTDGGDIDIWMKPAKEEK